MQLFHTGTKLIIAAAIKPPKALNPYCMRSMIMKKPFKFLNTKYTITDFQMMWGAKAVFHKGADVN